MKKILKFLPLLLIAVTLFSSCNKNGAGDKVKGDYTFNSDNALSVNGADQKSTDYPNASVSIKATGDDMININLNNIIPGYDKYEVAGTVEASTKAEGDAYIISGNSQGTDINVTVSGSVTGDSLKLTLAYEKKDAVVGKWMVNSALVDAIPYPDVYFTLNTNVDSISVLGQKMAIKDAVALLNLYMKVATAQMPVDYIEFTSTGFFNIHSSDAEVMSDLNDFNNRLEYYVADGKINFFFRNSTNAAVTSILAEYGITYSISVSFAIPYSITNNVFNLEVNKSDLAPVILIANTQLSSFTYTQFKQMAPDSKITEVEFNAYKQVAASVLTIITSNQTTLTLGANMIQYAAGLRPWQILN